MAPVSFENLPHMLYADEEGHIFDHPYYRMAGCSGSDPVRLTETDLISMPEFSKLFFLPDCPPFGLDPQTGEMRVVPDIEIDGKVSRCNAVAAFLEPGYVRSHLPAADYRGKTYTLPMWAYTSVGYRGDSYWAAGFQIEVNERWDPRNYDDRALIPAIKRFQGQHPRGPLLNHLIHCAVENHCFAAKNLFLGRWEAPLPVSRVCNADCLGCLSLQSGDACEESHHRITFKPDLEEIVEIAVSHLNGTEEGIVSFGQGCEGEPLTEYELIHESIGAIRKRTARGTINLNTNGSWPEKVRLLAEGGLDSIRISLNSARPDVYHAYYRARGYSFDDVVSSISIARKLGLYTMINYLVFPGVSDQAEEMEALGRLIDKTGIQFIHFKNLNIDPQLYLESVPGTGSPGMGLKKMADTLDETFPDLHLGYFNQPVRP